MYTATSDGSYGSLQNYLEYKDYYLTGLKREHYSFSNYSYMSWLADTLWPIWSPIRYQTIVFTNTHRPSVSSHKAIEKKFCNNSYASTLKYLKVIFHLDPATFGQNTNESFEEFMKKTISRL